MCTYCAVNFQPVVEVKAIRKVTIFLTDPFYPRQGSAPSTKALCNPGNVVHRVKFEQSHPRTMVAAARRAGGVRSSCLVHWEEPWPRPCLFHPGDIHFSQDHCHPAILCPKSAQESEWAERALIQQKEKKMSFFLT